MCKYLLKSFYWVKRSYNIKNNTVLSQIVDNVFCVMVGALRLSVWGEA